MKALKGALIAVSAAAVMAVLSAAPASADTIPFTWTPSAVGIGSSGNAIVNATNYNVTDYATITVDGSGNFVENGVLNVTGFLNAGGTVASPGLGSNYSLYYVFTGSGNQGGAIPTNPGQITAGAYTSLSYTLYAVNNTVSFSAGAGGVTQTGTAGAVALATGSLIPGTGFVSLQNVGNGQFSPTSNVEVSFSPESGEGLFFTDPAATTAVLQFGNFSATGTVVTNAGNQIFINGGGGNITEALAPVPEPVTLSLFGAGLAGAAFARRRKSKKA